MHLKRVKHDKGMVQDQEPVAGLKDRIPELPEVIILCILSCLPTLDAIRMSLVSKQWRQMWTSVPVLDFLDSRDIPYFKGHNKRNQRAKFYKLIGECLRRLNAGTTISTFKLCMQYYYGCGRRIDAWLRILEKKNVKELDLRFMPRARGYKYCLPQSVLNLRSLTLLKLSGLRLEILGPMSLPSLEELYLEKIKISDQALDNLLRSCPCLEKLRIDCCSGLLDPKVSSLTLKSMEFTTDAKDYYCFGRTIDVDAIDLHSFLLRGEFFANKNCGMNLVQCRAIRNLSLAEAFLTDEWLEYLIPELPLLETLDLTNCRGLQQIKIMNQHLKHFVFNLSRRSELLEATIDTPNLVTFSCSSYSLFKISVNAPNLLDAGITVSDHPRKTYNVEWYTTLIKFLSNLNDSKSLHVFFSHEKALIIPDELKKIYSSPLPDLQQMSVRTGGRWFRKAMLRKSLLWIAPSLETLPMGCQYKPGHQNDVMVESGMNLKKLQLQDFL